MSRFFEDSANSDGYDVRPDGCPERSASTTKGRETFYKRRLLAALLLVERDPCGFKVDSSGVSDGSANSR